MLNNKFVFIKNIFNLSLNQGINILFHLIYTPILFQTLGDEYFGLMHLAFSIFIILSIFVSFGYNLNGPVKLLEFSDQQNADNFLLEVLKLRSFIAFLIFLLCIPIIYFFSKSSLNWPIKCM